MSSFFEGRETNLAPRLVIAQLYHDEPTDVLLAQRCPMTGCLLSPDASQVQANFRKRQEL